MPVREATPALCFDEKINDGIEGSIGEKGG